MSINQEILEQARNDELDDDDVQRISLGGSGGRSGGNVGPYTRLGAYLTASHLISSTVLSYVLTGGPEKIPELYLAEALNVLVLPAVYFSGAFSFPLWAWYIIVLGWFTTLVATGQMNPD